MNDLKKLSLSFGFQGAAFGAIGIIINLFVVVGLGGNVAMANIALALYTFGNLAGSMIIGTFLDKYPYFFESIFLSVIADAIISFSMAISNNVAIYYILALMLGISATIMGPAITIFLNKKLDSNGYRKNVNGVNMVNSIGSTAGTFLGGFWLYLPFFNGIDRMKGVFVIGTALLIVSALLIVNYLKKKDLNKNVFHKSLFVSRKDFLDGMFLPFKFSGMKSESKKYMFALFLLFLGLNMIFSIFSVYFEAVLKISSSTIFIIYGINSIFGNAAYFLTGKMMNRFKDSLLIRLALWIRLSMFGIIIGSYFFLPYGGVTLTIVAFIITGFAWPFIYIPTTVKITNLALPSNRGRIIGMFNMVINLATIIASLIAGYVALMFGYVFSFIIGMILIFFVERVIYNLNKNIEKD